LLRDRGSGERAQSGAVSGRAAGRAGADSRPRGVAAAGYPEEPVFADRQLFVRQWHRADRQPGERRLGVLRPVAEGAPAGLCAGRSARRFRISGQQCAGWHLHPQRRHYLLLVQRAGQSGVDLPLCRHAAHL
ncbi:hypothetical protein LTR94_032602, partial [Friedmanniomyces endolithicus]